MLRFGSGTYNVRDSEIIRLESSQLKTSQKCVFCTVHFLDDTVEDFELDYRALGQELLDKVFQHLELIEKDYFGLQYVDVLPKHENWCWLDPTLSIRKQLRCPPYVLFLRVKFYVSDPSKLHEEYTRYHFYLQLRKDISDGKLQCSESSAALLGSYSVQSEFGDYNVEEHGETYLDGFQFLPCQTSSLIKKISELHRLHKGQTPADAEFNFLDHAKRLETYGVNIFKAQDQNFVELCLGAAAYGVSIFQKSQRINLYPWSKILEISFKRKQFSIRVACQEQNQENTTISFKLISSAACKSLWKTCVEHHTFFRLVAPPVQPPKSLFQLGSRYRYSGRTEYQTLEEMKRRSKIERTFHRAYSKISFARSSLIEPSRTSQSCNTPILMGNGAYHAKKLPNFSSASQHSSLLNSPASARFGDLIRKSETVGHNYHSLVTSDSMESATAIVRRVSTSSQGPSSFPNGKVPKETTFGVADETDRHNHNSAEPWTDSSPFNRIVPPQPLTSRSASSSNNSAPPPPPLPLENGFESYRRNGTTIQNQKQHNYVRRYSAINGASNQNNMTSHLNLNDDSLVTIRMKPDSQFRFGFNVKGGADLNFPIIVSRVIPGSQADSCVPRLNEGDQVLMINGHDVAAFSHDHVVRFIRNCRETPGKDLVLTVKPNAYIGEDIDEADFQHVPQSAKVADYVPRSDLLNQSIVLLRESIDSGKAVEQFERLYRRKPGMTTTICLHPRNINKNRYRDILPYDLTRVILEESDTGGDYINASFINMEIEATGIVNRYIAAQGPLPHTCTDFWRVIWEQVCPTVIMLTALNERGRPKCHKYWPDPGTSLQYQSLSVKCNTELSTYYGYCRELTLRCSKTNEERSVSQLQYSIWPDHGVPDDTEQFVNFLVQVRQSRAGMVEPLLVHCSAGIGRTGVMILMETAMCLIEANEPVYPLEIVKTMRDQRAMLIQTSSQYKFVCDAICKAYSDGTVKPLAEYQKDRATKK